ncbi:MAG: NusG domain II-containing protein [Methylotenera sp.]|jgi:hypothetical protein
MPFNFNPKPLLGDWLVIFASIIAVIFMFQQFWSFEHASKLKIRQGDKIVGTYDLNQTRELHIHGALGDSHIVINQGKVRFKQSPCNNQYCVHQGWLSLAGQVAICLPNQISLQLMGAKSTYDSLNY